MPRHCEEDGGDWDAIQSGMDAHILKPFVLNQRTRAVQEVLDKKKQLD